MTGPLTLRPFSGLSEFCYVEDTRASNHLLLQFDHAKFNLIIIKPKKLIIRKKNFSMPECGGSGYTLLIHVLGIVREPTMPGMAFYYSIPFTKKKAGVRASHAHRLLAISFPR